jgi:hypothetical protein
MIFGNKSEIEGTGEANYCVKFRLFYVCVAVKTAFFMQTMAM